MADRELTRTKALIQFAVQRIVSEEGYTTLKGNKMKLLKAVASEPEFVFDTIQPKKELVYEAAEAAIAAITSAE